MNRNEQTLYIIL